MNPRKRMSPKCLVALLVVFMLLFYLILLPFGKFMFDNHSLRGGEFGRMIDTLGRTIIFRRMMRKRRARLDALDIQLPPLTDVINKKGIPNLPQAAVAEVLMRNKIRERQMVEAESNAWDWSVKCRANATTFTPSIPNLVLQPDHGGFFRPLHAPGIDVMRFDHASMRQMIQGRFPALLRKFDRTIDKNEQSLIWSICALYSFGGYVFGRNHRTMNDDLNNFLSSKRGCDPIGVAMFEDSTSSENVTDSRPQIMVLAFSPNHALLNRVIEKLAKDDGAVDESRLLSLLCGDENWVARKNDSWEVITCSCSKHTPRTSDDNCCDALTKGTFGQINERDNPKVSSSEVKAYVKVVGSEQQDAPVDNVVGSETPVTVSIIEQPGTHPPVKVAKTPILAKLQAANCNAGWMCNRCLKNALLGNHDACNLVCPSCYREIICDDSSEKQKKEVHIDVTVTQNSPVVPGETRIPRVIHQTWFTEPMIDRYPQLARLQNSWKNLGWEYRFYNDEDVRQYISKNFPSRFLDAFDSVIPGAFKADFFRYLVLLKEGGVYADVDILLDINLDSFITPTLSFFVPRDIVGDYAGENFCLWNGMMGAAPGHPFMAQAAEMLLNNIMNRVDYYDMEREMCKTLGSRGEVWKMRALTILSLSGPCLLGSAVNKALGRSNHLSKYDPGWLIPDVSNATRAFGVDEALGDSLLLIASRADMGALRFSDVDRNLMVASTGMTELSKDPIITMEELAQVQEAEQASHVHYSNFEHVNDVFGAEGIYIDSLVTNENVKLNVKRENMGVKG